VTPGDGGAEAIAVRAGVLGWSTVSGAVMGLLAGAVLAAVVYVVLSLPPLRATALVERARLPAVVTVVVLATAIGALLGYLEGRLKLQ
jgi:hypothetical protein